MPCSGKFALDQRAHRVLGRAVGGRHRIEARGRALVLDAERGAEERQDRLAGHGRKLVDEGGKIDRGHAAVPVSARSRNGDWSRPATHGLAGAADCGFEARDCCR